VKNNVLNVTKNYSPLKNIEINLRIADVQIMPRFRIFLIHFLIASNVIHLVKLAQDPPKMNVLAALAKKIVLRMFFIIILVFKSVLAI
jgi:hypothetical protein